MRNEQKKKNNSEPDPDASGYLPSKSSLFVQNSHILTHINKKNNNKTKQKKRILKVPGFFFKKTHNGS